MLVPRRVYDICIKFILSSCCCFCSEHFPPESWTPGLKMPIWVFQKIGVPQNGWFIMENPIKIDDLGGFHPPIFGNSHVFFLWTTRNRNRLKNDPSLQIERKSWSLRDRRTCCLDTTHLLVGSWLNLSNLFRGGMEIL